MAKVTEARAAYFLAHYPQMWQQLENARQEVFDGLPGGRGEAFATAYNSGSGHSDPTARIALRICDALEGIKELQAVPIFLETLSYSERKLVLERWRSGGFWNLKEARKIWGRDITTQGLHDAWQEVVRKFANYLKAYVGSA